MNRRGTPFTTITAGLIVVGSACACDEDPHAPEGMAGAPSDSSNAGGAAGNPDPAGAPTDSMGAAGTAGMGGASSGQLACGGTAARFIGNVVDHSFGSGQDFGQDEFPEPILGPPLGGGRSTGGLDVVSLGDAGSVIFAFGNNWIEDGPGADFVVFENAFIPSGGSEDDVFAELARVSVSQDGTEWFEFSCAPEEFPYEGCAGWRPVLANAEENDLDPFSPEEGGGDPFDLADVGLSWARYVRIVDVADEGGETFDLDAAALIHPGCP